MALTEPAVSKEQVDFFQVNGFLALEELAGPDEVAAMRELYDRLFAERAGRGVGDQFDLAGADEDGARASLPQILRPSYYAPELLDMPCRERALAVARALLGDAAQPMGDHAIMKPAGHGAATPWHQDEAYWSPDLQYNSLSVWIPLQEATVANGCMHFIPGSHHLDVLPHHCINNDPRIHGLEVDDIDDSTAVACPLPPGGATFHMARTLHYAGPNHTDGVRRALILGFGTPTKPYPEPRRFPWNEQKQTAREARAAAAGENQDVGQLHDR